jgi:hypothetical protein
MNLFELGIAKAMEKIALKASTVASAAAKRGVGPDHLRAEVLNRVASRHRQSDPRMYAYAKRRMARTGYEPGARPMPTSSPLSGRLVSDVEAKAMNNRYTRSWARAKAPRNGLVELPQRAA